MADDLEDPLDPTLALPATATAPALLRVDTLSQYNAQNPAEYVPPSGPASVVGGREGSAAGTGPPSTPTDRSVLHTYGGGRGSGNTFGAGDLEVDETALENEISGLFGAGTAHT